MRRLFLFFRHLVNLVKGNTLESGAREKKKFQNFPSSVPTPINPKVIASELEGYIDSLVSYLVKRIYIWF